MADMVNSRVDLYADISKGRLMKWTPEEIKLINSLAKGSRNKQMARELGLEERRIEVLLRSARLKAPAKTNAQLVAIAVRAGFID
jgi:DNA-binding NarL/FixJ family response regulator